MMMSWFTRNAADHARGTAPTRCFATCTPARGESVMNLSVVPTRFSTRSVNLGFSEDDQGRQLNPLKYRMGRKRVYIPETISAGTSLGFL